MLESRGQLSVLAAVCLLFVATGSSAQQVTARKALPQPVADILRAHKMPASGLSVFVHRVDAKKPLLAVNADAARNPASIMKLVTTFVALEDLGPAYQWKTEAYADGLIDDGKLEGDLYLKGYGDPYLVKERFWLFLNQLQQRGLRDIAGDLVIDNAYFDVPAEDRGEFDGQALRTYNVTPAALLVNFQAISFSFLPDPVTGKVNIVADPLPANLKIRNALGLRNGRCGGFQNGITVAVDDDPALESVTFSGQIGRSCRESRLSRSLLQPASYAYGVFRAVWEDSNASLAGQLRLAPVPESLELFHRFDSLPLSDVIRSVNKWSNNVMARHLLLTVGAERFGPPATLEKGREAARMILAERGLNFATLRIDNGSGLSRNGRMTARELGLLLLAADASRFQAEFVSSLPLGGFDGTLRRRFREPSLAGRMHLKTGRLDDVFAMAGYVRGASGHDFVVVAIHNSPRAHRGPGEEAQTALIKWVLKQ